MSNGWPVGAEAKWQRVLSLIDADGICWEWRGYRTASGYGGVWLDGRQHRAHKLVYRRLVGPIPDGLQLDHLCRNKICVNPDHLEAVTGRENVRRGFGVAGTNARKTHCSQGHTLDGKRADGERYCLTCNRIRVARQVRRGAADDLALLTRDGAA